MTQQHVCPACSVPVRAASWPDGQIGVTHDEPLCDWFKRTATKAELDALALRLHRGKPS